MFMERLFYAKKIVLSIILVLLLIISFVYFAKGMYDYSRASQSCDAAKGSTCSYYEVRNHMIRGN